MNVTNKAVIKFYSVFLRTSARMDKFLVKLKNFRSRKREVQVEFEDFFTILSFSLKLYGINPFIIELKSKSEIIIDKVLLVIGAVMPWLSTLLYFLWAVENRQDPLAVLRSLPNVTNHIFLSARIWILYRNRQKLTMMSADLKEIFDALKVKNRKMVKNHLKRVNMLQSVIVALIITIWITQIIDFIASYIARGTETFTVELWLPFDHDTGLKYFCSCICLMWSALYSGSSFYITDWIIYTIVTLISLDFDMIGSEIKEILGNPHAKTDDLSWVVEHQNKLIDICNQLELIVSNSLLHNCLQGIIIICLLGFQLVVLDDVTQLAVYGLVLIVILGQISMMCYHGQMLIDSSSNVANSIYDSFWYSIDDKNMKKSVALLMMVAQTPKYLTAGGFKKISMEMFTSVSDNLTI